MSYKLRNTLFLLSLVVVFGAFGAYLLFFHFPKRIETLQQRLIEIDKSIEEIPKRTEYLANANKLIEVKTALIESVGKKIESEINLADVLNYLNEIQCRFGALKFEMAKIKDFQALGFAYTTLSITGEGNFNSVIGMIRGFDNGPKILNIETLSLRGVEGPSGPGNIRTIIMPFTLTVKALYAVLTDLPPISRKISDITIPKGPNIFLPLVAANLPANTEGLLEAERASLQAILPDKAIIIDHGGKIHALVEGSEVYLGYLTKIDLKNNRVEFTLNKGGIIERFYLSMSFQQTE